LGATPVNQEPVHGSTYGSYSYLVGFITEHALAPGCAYGDEFIVGLEGS
jgi:hypothetical protein